MAAPITRAQVLAALDKSPLPLKYTCPFCGSQSLMLPVHEGTDHVHTMSMLSNADATAGVAFAPLICLKCSSTQFLHVETLLSFA